MKFIEMIEAGSVATPIGELPVFARNGVLVFVDLHEDARSARDQVRRRFAGEEIRPSDDPGGCVTVFDRYFSGDLTALDELAVDPGGTPFQARVWRALRKIRPGTTTSYRDLAHQIGARNAVRAVGAANGANPIPLVIPCHRVIGASGRLVGYGGGLEKKAWLLRHEGWRPLAP